MISVTTEEYGFRFVFRGIISPEETAAFFEEIGSKLERVAPGFVVLADARGLSAPSEQTQKALIDGEHLFRQAGMERSATIVDSPDIQRIANTVAYHSGIRDRCIDASKVQEWEEVAMAWLHDGVDPEPVRSRVGL